MIEKIDLILDTHSIKYTWQVFYRFFETGPYYDVNEMSAMYKQKNLGSSVPNYLHTP